MTYLAVAILFAVLLLVFSVWKEKGLLLGTVAPEKSPAQWTTKRQLWSVLTTVPQLLLFFVMCNFFGWFVVKCNSTSRRCISTFPWARPWSAWQSSSPAG